MTNKVTLTLHEEVHHHWEIDLDEIDDPDVDRTDATDVFHWFNEREKLNFTDGEYGIGAYDLAFKEQS